MPNASGWHRLPHSTPARAPPHSTVPQSTGPQSTAPRQSATPQSRSRMRRSLLQSLLSASSVEPSRTCPRTLAPPLYPTRSSCTLPVTVGQPPYLGLGLRVRRGRDRRAAVSNASSGAAGTSRTFASTALNLRRRPRLARSARYSSVMRAASFSATAELIIWSIETPSRSATSASLRWMDSGKRRLSAAEPQPTRREASHPAALPRVMSRKT